MTSETSNGREFPLAGSAVPERVSRPVYWSIRRELWENRSLYIAPLLVAAFAIFGSLVNSATGLPKIMRTLDTLEPARRQLLVYRPFSLAAAAIMFATLVVGWFYSLDALYGERRDRSVLFWKSLPVSDRTTVLAKAGIPMALLPLFAFLLCVATQAVMIVVSTIILAVGGVSPAGLWSHYPFVQGPLVMLYGLTVHALWLAPMHGWLLLVSAWARRAPFLWAFLPFVLVSVVERVAFNTTYFQTFMRNRLMGAMPLAFGNVSKGDGGIINRLVQLTPGKFLASPSLWIGLFFAAAFLAMAVRVRRHRAPL